MESVEYGAISAGKLGALSSEILRPDQRVHDDASQVLVCNDTKYRDMEPSAVFASNSLKPHAIESSLIGPDKSARINSMRASQPVPPREASTPQHIPVGAKTDSQDVGVASNHLTIYDHQNIVVLEDDPVVMESASFLYEKHPSVSTLLSYQKGALYVIRGSRNFDDPFLRQFRTYNAESYAAILHGLNSASFNHFVHETFSEEPCKSNCARWGHYFMAAVFAESVRNFRNFPLFLMSVAGCYVNPKSCMDFATPNTHPMARGGSWIEPKRRGFYGCSLYNTDQNIRDKEMPKLKEGLKLEKTMFGKSWAILHAKNSQGQQPVKTFSEILDHLNNHPIFGDGSHNIIMQDPFNQYIDFLKKQRQGSSSTTPGECQPIT